MDFATAMVACLMTMGAQTPSPAADQHPSIDAPEGETLVVAARGEGVQIYSCQEDGSWKLKAPDATLFDAGHHALGIHFAGPRWRFDDGSEVQGKLKYSEPHPGTIPWLFLTTQSTGNDGTVAHVDVVTRTDTDGGMTPATGCDAQHVNAESRVPYSAKYSFYTTKK